MIITVYFYRSSTPATGLTPIIRIRDVETGDVVDSGSMSEVGGGFYKKEFFGYDITKDYLILCDAVILPNQYRYKSLATGEYGNTINDINLIADGVDIRVALIRKIMMNKYTLIDGDTQNLILYDDDSFTPLLKWDIKDSYGQIIIQQNYEPSNRSRGM
jgi:hypothetical protein